MLSLFEPVKTYVILKPRAKVLIDGHVFRLHYKITVAILMAFSIVITTKQYIGSPIECLMDKSSKVPKDFMEAYCWVHSTFTILNLLNSGSDVPHPGIGQLEQHHSVKYHRYYQWVWVILTFQAILFYAPHFLWRAWERERVRILVEELKKIESDQKMTLKDRNDGIKKQISLITDYFVRNRYSWKSNNMYAFQYFFCEFLNTLNVLFQLILTNIFLDFEFSTYGMDALVYTETDPFQRIDPINRVFPKVTKCIFNMHGPSGNIVPYDALCLLPINVFNEKFYIFLYFWFILLAGISLISLTYRILSATLPTHRIRVLLKKTSLEDPAVASIVTVGKFFSIGDWFLLNQVGRNLDLIVFRELMVALAQALKNKRKLKV